ncbi:MAG: hypothetical protein Q9202_005064 [Teloschistes flavicans]
MSSQERPIATNDISHKFSHENPKNIGGKGCFNGGVFIVRSKRTGQKYIEKRYVDADIDNDTARFEMSVLRKLRHPNIVEYIAGFIDRSNPRSPKAAIYLEYCDRGNLHDCIKNANQHDEYLRESAVWSVFMQLVNALSYLQHGIRDACHESEQPAKWTGILHRDIKPDNVFLSSTHPDGPFARVILGDFSQADRNDFGEDRLFGRHYLPGNQITAAPEILDPHEQMALSPYTFASDVYSLGFCISSVCRLTLQRERLGDAGGKYSGVLNEAIRMLMH